MPSLLKVVPSCSTYFHNGHFKPNFRDPNVPPCILTYKLELTILIHKIVVCIVASAHEWKSYQIKDYQGVGTTLLKHGLFELTIIPTNLVDACSR